MKYLVGPLFLLLLAVSAVPSITLAQSEEISNLQNRVSQLERKVSNQSKELSRVEEIAKNTAPLLLLFGAFCALWAQNSGRNAWVWFFTGVFFSVFTVLVLLALNEPPEHNKSFKDRDA